MPICYPYGMGVSCVCDSRGRIYRCDFPGVGLMKGGGGGSSGSGSIDVDAQHLLNTSVPHRMLIGKELTRGLGAGSEPSIGEGAAEEARSDLLHACSDADIVFLTGGLGGGTGTGSLPIIAKLAKERGALTIAIVTLPFGNEGARRSKNARIGIEKLRK